MSLRSNAVFLIFALVFAMGMALAVALLCMPTASDEPPVGTLPQEAVITDAGTVADTEAGTLPPAVLPDVSNGLAFRSLGGGSCAVSGIGSCADACVVIPEFAPSGERVVQIEPRAFYGVSTVTAVQIPASVRDIGSLAFAACENLMYVSVSAKNESFCDLDGVLYSFDRSTLLLYPPLRAGSTAYISSDTTHIADMAFYGCVYLTSIHYDGSPEQWESISIAPKNYSLIAAAVVFGEQGDDLRGS